MIQQGLQGPLYNELFGTLKAQNIQFQYVPIEKLNALTRSNHQGIIAFVAAIEYQNFEEIITRVTEEGEVPFILVIDHITDVRNFGAICRTAECAGVHAIIIPSKGMAQINADAIKTSAGALNILPVCRVENLKAAIYSLKEYGLKIFGCTEKTNTSYSILDYTEPLAIVMGSEDKGISDDILKLCDRKAKIPLMGKIESLNVSVAAGIVLYEVVKQRQAI